MSETKIIPLQQFKHDSAEVAADGDRREFLRTALGGYMNTRTATQHGYQDWEAARSGAAEIKWEAIDRLPELLEQFEANLIKNGTKVFWASDEEEARQYILGILREKNAKHVIKSKTMTSEEIHLNSLLEAEGFDVVESDLGEYIVQQNKEAPYHFVFPCMHLKRAEIKAIFEKIAACPSDDPEALTMFARQQLREKYLRADVGISGGNFGIAETGHIAITENEGNARLTCAMPKVHIAIMGIEKMLPRLSDLSLLQPMLGTAGAGQRITCYNSIYGGPKKPGETDGPEEMHVVLLDNGRTTLLADPEQRDALRCIRCGACLNVCPIFKNIGGHSYGTTYQGPIGAVITPHYKGLQEFKHLAYASSLCGACTETCPVKIDLHHHLLRIRRNSVSEHPPLMEKVAMKGFAFAFTRPWLYHLGTPLARLGHWLSKPIQGTKLDPGYLWRKTRTLPDMPKESFHEWFEKREQQKKAGK